MLPLLDDRGFLAVDVSPTFSWGRAPLNPRDTELAGAQGNGRVLTVARDVVRNFFK